MIMVILSLVYVCFGFLGENESGLQFQRNIMRQFTECMTVTPYT